MSDFNKKFWISFNSAILFTIVSLPKTYHLTQKITNLKLFDNNCPTYIGRILHAVVFFLISYITMGSSRINNLIKIKHSLYGTLIYYFISSPELYNLTSLILKNVATSCPNTSDIYLHAIVYCLALIGVMYLP